MKNILSYRTPTHPGKILKVEFLVPLHITQIKLATDLIIPYQFVIEITNLKRGITPSIALRLAKYFGTTPDFWMNLQLRWDLYHAIKKDENVLRKLRTYQSKKISGIGINYK